MTFEFCYSLGIKNSTVSATYYCLPLFELLFDKIPEKLNTHCLSVLVQNSEALEMISKIET